MNSHSFFIDFTTWKGHEWALSSPMLEGVSPVLGAHGPHMVYSWSLWVGCISSLKNHHASYQNQTIEEKKILGVPLFSGRWDITLISGALSEFKTNGNQLFCWEYEHCANLVWPCVMCVMVIQFQLFTSKREWEISLFRKRQCSPPPLWMDDQVLHIIVCQLLGVHNIPVGV